MKAGFDTIEHIRASEKIMNKMLVLAPHPFFTPRGTPFSVYYRTLITAEKGVLIDLLTYHPGQEVDIEGVRTIRIPRIAFLEPVPVGPSAKKLILDVIMIVWTVALLLKNRYTAVHAHEESVFWARMLKPLFRYRLVYDMHSSLPQQLENFGFTKSKIIIGIFRFLENSCLRAADAVITICPDLRDYVLELRIPEDRHFLIENSIFDDVNLKPSTETDQATTPADNKIGLDALTIDRSIPVILYAGTFESYQGIDVLIAAFADLLSDVRATLVLAGGTEDQIEISRNQATELKIIDQVIFTGRVSKTQALALTREADILVSPRVKGTNTPLKIYEQLASGKPLIATNIYSHTQVLTGEVCFLVEPESHSMAQGMLLALSKPKQAQKRAIAAQKLYSTDYSRPVYESKMESLLSLIGMP